MKTTVFVSLDLLIGEAGKSRDFPRRKDIIRIPKEINCTLHQKMTIFDHFFIGFLPKIIVKSPADEDGLQECIIEIMKQLTVPLEDVLYCPHRINDNCRCRPPKAGLINDACLKHKIDVSHSILVGTETDKSLAKNASIPTYLSKDAYFGIGVRPATIIGGNNTRQAIVGVI